MSPKAKTLQEELAVVDAMLASHEAERRFVLESMDRVYAAERELLARIERECGSAHAGVMAGFTMRG